MKNLIASFVAFTALLLPSHDTFTQEIDSLILPTVNVAPGDTATLALSLHNQSFNVGAFSIQLVLTDTSEIRFIDAQGGNDVLNFVVLHSQFTSRSASINGIANWPNYAPVPPLPLGNHEIAVIQVEIDDTVNPGSMFCVCFDNSNVIFNVISDSSGYETLQPYTVDGTIIVESSTGIENRPTTPESFVLYSNYPNPFNARTNIDFSVEQPGHALLEIYDILGKKVAVLVDEYVSAGTHGVTWDGTSDTNQPLASGIYFYRLSFENKSEVRKMSLVK